MNRVRPNYYKHPDVRDTEINELKERVAKLTQLAHEQQHVITKKTMELYELRMDIVKGNNETNKNDI